MGPLTSAEIRPARTHREREAALKLRRRVFCEEQSVAVELELDGRDPEALHIVAMLDGEVVGTCRLLVEAGTAKLGRMAVERSARRRGIGLAMLDAAEEAARASGARRIALHAQTYVSDLYARGGYVVRGRPFDQAGIEHVLMERRLA